MRPHPWQGMLLSALFVFCGLVQAAETVFYQNTRLGGISLTAAFLSGDHEIADDAPFTGSHELSSFRFGYSSPEPVRVLFRFYGVDPVDGNPGQFITQLVREFPAGTNVLSTVILTPEERFVLSAEPGLKQSTATGAWFSLQFEPVLSNQLPDGVSMRMAYGDSIAGMYDMTLQRYTQPYDPGGVLPRDLFFEMRTAGGTVIPSDVQDMELQPASVTAGGTGTAIIRLSAPATAGGVEVNLSSNKPRVANFTRRVVHVPQGDDQIRVVVETSPTGVRRRPKTVTLTAESENNRVSALLTVTRE